MGTIKKINMSATLRIRYLSIRIILVSQFIIHLSPHNTDDSEYGNGGDDSCNGLCHTSSSSSGVTVPFSASFSGVRLTTHPWSSRGDCYERLSQNTDTGGCPPPPSGDMRLARGPGAGAPEVRYSMESGFTILALDVVQMVKLWM